MKPEVIAAILGDFDPPEGELTIEEVAAQCDSVVMASGTEARVIAMIANRQAMGVKKYGCTVSENMLSLREWLQHALEESLDKSIYLQRAIEQIDAESDDGK